MPERKKWSPWKKKWPSWLRKTFRRIFGWLLLQSFIIVFLLSSCVLYSSVLSSLLYFSLAIVRPSPHVNEVIRVWHFINGRPLDSRLLLHYRIRWQNKLLSSHSLWNLGTRVDGFKAKILNSMIYYLIIVIFTWTYAKVLFYFTISIYPFYFENSYIHKIFTILS